MPFRHMLCCAALRCAVRPLLLSLPAVLPLSDQIYSGLPRSAALLPPLTSPAHERCCVQGNYSDLLVSLSAVYSDLRGDAVTPQSEEGLEVRGL